MRRTYSGRPPHSFRTVGSKHPPPSWRAVIPLLVLMVVAALLAVFLLAVTADYMKLLRHIDDERNVTTMKADRVPDGPVSPRDVSYIWDPRTGLCFAKIKGDQQHIAVPCLMEVEALSVLRPD
jgi:hypothetical protein